MDLLVVMEIKLVGFLGIEVCYMFRKVNVIGLSYRLVVLKKVVKVVKYLFFI